MKLKIEQADLLDGINTVSRAVTTRTTMPILECIHLSADDNGVQLTGNNLEMCIQTASIEAGVEQAGAVALDARLFSEIVKKMPDAVIEITVDEMNAATIKSGKRVFNIAGSPAADYPTVVDVARDSKFTISRVVLRDMIRQTIFSVSMDETKPVLTGELLKASDGLLEIVSVDGFRISHRCHTIQADEQSFSVIAPGKTLGELVRLLSAADSEDVGIYFDEKQVLFELDNCTLFSRLLEGEFIKYEASLQVEQKTLVRVNRIELIISLESACLVAIETGRKTPVRLQIEGNSIVISSRTERGTVDDEIDAEIEGKAVKIGFNPRYLIEALKAIDDQYVMIQFSGSLAPCIIRPVEDGNYKYLVLPLKLDK